MMLRMPNSVVNATLGEPAVCEEHCMHTWQCTVCGALIHGTTGRDAHVDWHQGLMDWHQDCGRSAARSKSAS